VGNPPAEVMFDREDELDTDMIEKLPPTNPAEGLKPIREWEEDLLDANLKSFEDLRKEGLLNHKVPDQKKD
jgi:hypothetical protein